MSSSDVPAAAVPAPIFPPATIPTVFTDGALNFNHSPQVVKFYLFRFDPALTGSSAALPQVIAQVVMPVPSMVHTAAFFNAAIENLVRQGHVSEADWKAAKESNLRDFKFNV
jgi:hypothetical protein